MRTLLIRLPVLAALTALGAVGCDRSYAPCVEMAAVPVLWADCPDHASVELAGVTVEDAAGDAVWGASSPKRTGTLIDKVIYGQAPAGWNSTGAAPALTSGATFTVQFSYYDAMSAATSFKAF